MDDWWGLAGEWRRFTATDPSGIIRSQRFLFASERGVSIQTVARADAARRFVERLVRLGRIELTDVLQRAPVTFVATLARIERHSPPMVDELLSELADGRVSGSELLSRERQAKAGHAYGGPRPPVPSVRGKLASGRAFELKAATPKLLTRPQDGYALRGRSPDFSRRVMAALGEAGSPIRDKVLVRVSAETLPAPLVLDALALLRGPRGEAYRGMRAYALGVDENDRKRLTSALLLGLAMSRILSEYWAVFERAADAIALTKMLEEFGAIGFGVARLDESDGLFIERLADRQHPPDLEASFAPRLRMHAGGGADTDPPPKSVSAPGRSSGDAAQPGEDTLLNPDKARYADSK